MIQARQNSPMKTCKSLTLLYAFGAFLTAAVQAQDSTTPPSEGRRGKGGKTQGGGQTMSPEARVERLDKALTLTADQKAQITKIYAKAQEDMRSAMRDGGAGGDREAARKKMMEKMQATRDEVRGVLTDEQ